MDDTNSQPDSGSQEAASLPVADNLGTFDERSIAEFIKNNFLNEEGAAPAKEEQQAEAKAEETEPETLDGEQTDEEPEAEAEANQSTDDEGEADESSLSRGVQKRINKLVAAKKAAQAKLQEQEAKVVQLQRELEATKSLSGAAKPQKVSDEVEGLNSIAEVEAEYQRAINVLLWCEENPDGGEMYLPGKEEPVLISDQQSRAMKRTAMKMKEIDLPQRYKYLQQQQDSVQQTLQNFPWWKKPESEEYQAATSVLAEFPELKRRPDWMYLAGVVVEGLRSVAERASKPKTPAPIKRAPAQPAPKAPPAPSKEEPLSKATKNFITDTSNRDRLSDLLKANGFV